jgi:hypothetical protein
MNFPSFPHWLSPGWIALYIFVGAAFYLYGNALARQRYERDCRNAERDWPEVRGTVFSIANNSALPQVIVEVAKGPQCGRYRVEVTARMRDGLSIGQELICRVGRHPGDRVSAPLRCVIERVL